jgi:hypothetical protein
MGHGWTFDLLFILFIYHDVNHNTITYTKVVDYVFNFDIYKIWGILCMLLYTLEIHIVPLNKPMLGKNLVANCSIEQAYFRERPNC